MHACSLSIIVPVYNGAAFLEGCLASLRSARGEDIEFILVDDGSTDGSATLLAQHASLDARVRVITQANAGTAVARNRGITAARGTWVWFVDADDIVSSDAIDKLRMAFAEPSLDLVAFNAMRCEGERSTPIYRQPKPLAPVSGESWVTLLCQQHEWRHLVWMYAARRAFLADIALIFREGIVHEDIAWVTEATVRAKNIRYLDQVLYHYRVNAESITGGLDESRVMRRIESYFTVLAQLRDINRRCAMLPATQKTLRAEVVGQAVEMDRLINRLESIPLQKALRARCHRERLWVGLWSDAVTMKRKRQVIVARWREWVAQHLMSEEHRA